MTDIWEIEQALRARLEEVEAQLQALGAIEHERARLRRALRALRGEPVAPRVACAARAADARPHAPPWQPDRLRR